MRKTWLQWVTHSCRTLILVAGLALVAANTLASGHFHAEDYNDGPGHFDQVDNCTLCHGAGAAILSSAPADFVGDRRQTRAIAPASPLQFGYRYIPQSRPPPFIS